MPKFLAYQSSSTSVGDVLIPRGSEEAGGGRTFLDDLAGCEEGCDGCFDFRLAVLGGGRCLVASAGFGWGLDGLVDGAEGLAGDLAAGCCGEAGLSGLALGETGLEAFAFFAGGRLMDLFPLS